MLLVIILIFNLKESQGYATNKCNKIIICEARDRQNDERNPDQSLIAGRLLPGLYQETVIYPQCRSCKDAYPEDDHPDV